MARYSGGGLSRVGVCAVEGDSEVAQILAADAAALQQFKQQPLAVMPVALEVTQPVIYTQEQPAGGVLCSALMWTARNLVRPACPAPLHPLYNEIVSRCNAVQSL